MPDLYTDGGVMAANPSAIGGTYAWRRVEGGEVVACGSGTMLPCEAYPAISNNMTELLALVKGLEALPEGWSGNVNSDSKIALGWIFHGYKRENAVPSLCRRADAAVRRLGHLLPVLLDGHPTQAQLADGRGKAATPAVFTTSNATRSAAASEERTARPIHDRCFSRRVSGAPPAGPRARR